MQLIKTLMNAMIEAGLTKPETATGFEYLTSIYDDLDNATFNVTYRSPRKIFFTHVPSQLVYFFEKTVFENGTEMHMLYQSLTHGLVRDNEGRKAQLNGHFKPRVGPVEYRTARKPIGHVGPCPYIFTVIVLALIFAEDAVGRTCKTGVIPRGYVVALNFCIQSGTGLKGGAASETYGIGIDRPRLGAVIVKRNHSAGRLTLFEMKRSQI